MNIYKSNNTTFIDETLVAKLGGNINHSNLLDYFSMSHFFDQKSINNICSKQKIDFESNRFNFKGIEYTIIPTEFSPYIILMNNRDSSNKTEKICYFYCYENGEIKQATSMFDFIASSVKTISYDLEKALNILEE